MKNYHVCYCVGTVFGLIGGLVAEVGYLFLGSIIIIIALFWGMAGFFTWLERR